MRQVGQGVLELTLLVSRSFLLRYGSTNERTRRVTSQNVGITLRMPCAENIMLRICRFLLPAIPIQGCVSETAFRFLKRVNVYGWKMGSDAS